MVIPTVWGRSIPAALESGRVAADEWAMAGVSARRAGEAVELAAFVVAAVAVGVLAALVATVVLAGVSGE